MGVCNPVIQANGCAANGDACAAFPFVDYSCNTIQTGGGNSLVCLPPTTAGAGELVSNANDWSTTATSCSTTNACTGPQQCFDTTNPVYGNELKACTGASGSCACYSPHSCQSSRGANDGCTQPNSCLDTSGVADGMNDPAIPGTVTCGTNETCYCSPQAIYSGTCGPLNSSWATASTTPLGSTDGFERDFKKACPSAYSYQFDDVASDFTCTNTVANQVNYKVTFCPSVPLNSRLIVTPSLLNFGLIAPSKMSKSRNVTVLNPNSPW